jgi:autotransporter-associated beta strand protein
VTNNASLAFDRTDTVTVPNAISGSGQLIQRGTGTLEITGDSNVYTGGTTVSAGTLLVNNSTNSGLGTGQVTVNGGTLGGTGSFTGALVINTTGVLSPGASIASLDTGALTLNSGSAFAYELNTTAVTGDLLNANGNLDLNGTVTLNLTDLGSGDLLAAGTKFALISYSGSWIAGDVFNGYADDSIFTLFNNSWLINYNDLASGSVNGGSYTNAVTLTVIPEPAAALLGGLGALFLLRRRR